MAFRGFCIWTLQLNTHKPVHLALRQTRNVPTGVLRQVVTKLCRTVALQERVWTLLFLLWNNNCVIKTSHSYLERDLPGPRTGNCILSIHNFVVAANYWFNGGHSTAYGEENKYMQRHEITGKPAKPA